MNPVEHFFLPSFPQQLGIITLKLYLWNEWFLSFFDLQFELTVVIHCISFYTMLIKVVANNPLHLVPIVGKVPDSVSMVLELDGFKLLSNFLISKLEYLFCLWLLLVVFIVMVGILWWCLHLSLLAFLHSFRKIKRTILLFLVFLIFAEG